MKSFTSAYSTFFRKYFPSPFSLAILLSILSFVLAFLLTKPEENALQYIPKLGQFWFSGMFSSSLLAFTVQMMLILVLGHVLALTSSSQKLINYCLRFATDTPSAAFTVSFITLLVALFNWGLGLIFGAILARRIAEKFQSENKKLNYNLIGAAAYVGLMVWHGGISGSAPLTVSQDHNFSEQMGIIPMLDTIFSPMNIFCCLLLIVLIPTTMYIIGKFTKKESIPRLQIGSLGLENKQNQSSSEYLENSSFFTKSMALFFLSIFVSIAYIKISKGTHPLNILNLSSTNLLLFGLALLLHKNLKYFLSAVDQAIGSVSGILIQFPLYFGILGVLKDSGLATLIAAQLTQTASQSTLPIYTFISAGILNLFVPSGGGQWQIQAPIIIETAKNTGTPLAKLIMAMAYGDQLTNMLQPFWALPLLGLTGLKAKDILTYTLALFLLGCIIFTFSIKIF